MRNVFLGLLGKCNLWEFQRTKLKRNQNRENKRDLCPQTKKKIIWKLHAKFKENAMYVETTQQSVLINTVLSTYLVRVQIKI